MQRTAVSLTQHSRKRISLLCYLFFPCWIHCSAIASLRGKDSPGYGSHLQKCHFTPITDPAWLGWGGHGSLPAQLCQAVGAVPVVHMRCCPWCSVSCPASPWGISGGPGARRAARGSRGPAAAPPAAPAAACRGCSLRRAEASSSPSDPSGSTAARQWGTRQAHQELFLHPSQLPKKPQQKTRTAWHQGEACLPLPKC